MGWQDTLAHTGYALELVGLGVAAFGMWRSWKVNAQGAAFWPRWTRAAYFKVARLWGQTPRPLELKGGAGSALGVVAHLGVGIGRAQGGTVDERLDRIEAAIDQLRVEAHKLASQQQAHQQRLDRKVESLRDEIARAQQATERRLSAQSVTDLRPAAYGIALAAFGLLLQWIGGG